jgi:hypothetical protein
MNIVPLTPAAASLRAAALSTPSDFGGIEEAVDNQKLGS